MAIFNSYVGLPEGRCIFDGSLDIADGRCQEREPPMRTRCGKWCPRGRGAALGGVDPRDRFWSIFRDRNYGKMVGFTEFH